MTFSALFFVLKKVRKMLKKQGFIYGLKAA